MEQTECSETSAYKTQTPGNYLEESIQHSEHGESCLKSTIKMIEYWKKAVDWIRHTEIVPIFFNLLLRCSVT
jgi:hypothetical protein